MMQQIIDNAIAINYGVGDKNDLIHILTEYDFQNVSYYVSPSARNIYTSIYIANILKCVKITDSRRKEFRITRNQIKGMCLNEPFYVRHERKEYQITFLDSMYSPGSIAVLIRGEFGNCLYTGNFCYYPEFCKLPLLKNLKKGGLQTLYFDGTYFEQKSNFLSFEKLVQIIKNMITANKGRTLYIFAEVSCDNFLAEISVRLGIRMKFHRFQKNREKDIYEQRREILSIPMKEPPVITITTTSDLPNGDPTIILSCHREYCTSFESIVVSTKLNYSELNIYAHSSHSDCCKLLSELVPEKYIVLGKNNVSSIDYSRFQISESPEIKKFSLFDEDPNMNSELIAPLKKLSTAKKMKSVVNKEKKAFSSQSFNFSNSEGKLLVSEEVMDITVSGFPDQKQTYVKIEKADLESVNSTNFSNLMECGRYALLHDHNYTKKSDKDRQNSQSLENSLPTLSDGEDSKETICLDECSMKQPKSDTSSNTTLLLNAKEKLTLKKRVEPSF